jgi:hypothetical protein
MMLIKTVLVFDQHHDVPNDMAKALAHDWL